MRGGSIKVCLREAPMIADLPINVDKAAFLAWVESRERKRFELVEGRVVEAEPHTRSHAIIAGNLARVLHRALDRRRWYALLSFGVDTGPRTIRDPDVLVDQGGRAKDVLANAPILIAEVLSPCSIAVDLADKSVEYMNLPSLCAYLVLSQDEPKAWSWIRDEHGFPPGPQVISGHDATIRIDALSIDLPLSEIYADFPPPETQT
jgi:Uma2 family endonuclease